VDYVAPLL